MSYASPDNHSAILGVEVVIVVTTKMRSVKLAVLSTALLLAGGGQAVDLILSTANGPCTLPLTSGSNVTIDPNTGNVLASVATGASCPQLAGNAPLTVTKTGAGSGTVVSSPAGINCGASCSAQFPSGSTVSLTASAGSGSVFAGWSGDCTGTGSCTVTMTAARNVTATFNVAPTYQLTVNKAGTGSGTVSSSPSGISCGSSCSANFNQGSTVTLMATPDSGSTFAGWSGGGCSGTGACSVTMNSNQTVTATFNTGSSVPAGCDGVTPPSVVGTWATTTTVKVSPGYSEQNANARLYAELFRLPLQDGGTPVAWPGNTQTRVIRVPKTGHIAAEFTVPTTTSFTRWDLEISTHNDTVPNIPAMITISRCPGNFNTTGPNAVPPNCYMPFGSEGTFSADLVASASSYTGPRCPIERGQTYYLNIAHYIPAQPTEPGCTGSTQCSIFLRAITQ